MPGSREQKFPTKAELLEHLKKLQEISEKNQQLTQSLAGGKQISSLIKKEIEACAEQQSKIVNIFLELSNNETVKNRYLELLNKTEQQIAQLEAARNIEQLQKLKVDIIKTIQEWVRCLETLIIGVLGQASE